MLDQVEHVALGRALRVPPSPSVVVHDQDLAVAAPVLQRPPRAALLVEPPGWRQALEERGAADVIPEEVELRILAGHHTMLLVGEQA